METNIDDNSIFNRKRKTSNKQRPTYAGVPSIEYDHTHREKSWQQVIFEYTRKGTHLYEPVKSVPSIFLIVLLGFYMFLGYLTQLNEDAMPNIITESELTPDNTDTFSEEAAWKYLQRITGDQPRVAGTKYHLQKTKDMKDLVDEVAAKASLPVRTDWQFVSDDFWLEFAAPHVNLYQNLSNIIVVLEGQSGFHINGSIGSSLLVNCHYDSVPFALGASDNAVFCAVMIETLSKLSKRRNNFKHNIVFLFNGAEENPLQGSHGFLHHKWSKNVISVINLDAAGMNGKANLFQVTDIRVLNAYKKSTSRPSAQAFGEYLFQTGVVPSDTDFRIFRDFGQMNGVDIAFVKWGAVYHTRYDSLELIKPGVVQAAGDMLLNLVSILADTQDLEQKNVPSAAIYYDYLNLFMLAYSFVTAHIVDSLILLLGLVSVLYYVWLVGFRLTTIKELCYSVMGRILSMAIGAIVAAALIYLMILTTVQMRYLNRPWITVPIFWMPYLITATVFSQLFGEWRTKKSGLNRSIRTVQAMAASRLILCVILLLMLTRPKLVLIRYIISVPLLMASVASIISLTVLRYLRMQAWRHLILECVLSIPSVVYFFSMALRIDALLLPIMGRTPINSPDMVIGGLNVGLAILTPVTISGIELLFSRKRFWIPLSALSIATLVIMFVPMNPYSDDGPATQRHYWFHSEINSYDQTGAKIAQTSGVIVTKIDAYTTETVQKVLIDKGINIKTRTDFEEDCQKYTYCNLPLFRTRFGKHMSSSLFLYMNGPAPFNPTPSLKMTDRSCFGETCTLHFDMIGTTHNRITILPNNNVELKGWSFNSNVSNTLVLNQRKLYNIEYSVATYSDNLPTLKFNLTLIVPLSLQSGVIVEISHHAHKIHHPEDFTIEYKNLLNAMPKYFNIASTMSVRNNYKF